MPTTTRAGDSSQETTVRRLRHGRARAAAAIAAASADADELGEGSSSSEEQDSGGMVADDPNDAANEAVKHPRGTSRYLQLYCRTGYNLVIHANGKVNGTREDRNRYGQCTDVLLFYFLYEDVRELCRADLPPAPAPTEEASAGTVTCRDSRDVISQCPWMLWTAAAIDKALAVHVAKSTYTAEVVTALATRWKAKEKRRHRTPAGYFVFPQYAYIRTRAGAAVRNREGTGDGMVAAVDSGNAHASVCVHKTIRSSDPLGCSLLNMPAIKLTQIATH
ncbi:hypothetical protein HPB51_002481 [Rhipicephalus microplus]|uniref:Uncharacterized protein n=1 Tax=Rhipicephalus microplus TaxID=6941 RepID=A0A9J6DEH3_RHIMP|nr:hypothetical protein HPB51_002481 [Rhipicephalus microplus]